MNGSEGYKVCDKTSSTMNFESIYTDVGPQACPREDSNESGTTLKAHDYIGLSEVSSANSSNEGHPESGRVEVLDLNESATVLRLGPPAAPKADVKEAGRDGRAAELGRSGAGGSHRNNHAILEEFRKAQAMKAAMQHGEGHAGHGAMAKGASPNMPMYHRPIKGYEAGQKGGYAGCIQTTYGVFGGGGVKNNGVKRGFSETVGMHGEHGAVGSHGGGMAMGMGVGMGMGMGGSEQGDVKVKVQGGGKMWMGNGCAGAYSMQKRGPVQDGGESSAKASVEAKAASSSEAIGGVSNEEPSSPAQTQTVGWPPVKSFVRKNKPAKPAAPPAAPTTACPSAQGKDAGSGANSNRLVKIYMDGVPFGRKVDLKTNNRYEKLYPALEEMFQQFISGQYSGSQASSSSKSQFVASSSRKLNFLDGSEYVLIYEDHEGDFMLVGDVPWELFVNTVKRLRIMKGSEQVNLGPKSADPVKGQGAVG